jgi:hypothetical protein
MNQSDPNETPLRSVLRAVAEADARLAASPAVEARLRQEVSAIASLRRRAILKVYAVAAVLILAVAGSVWSLRGRVSGPVADVSRSPFSVPGSAEQTTEFFALHYSNVPTADAHIVRLEVSRTALASFGLETRETPVKGAAATVLADVIVGSDGLARAIRFVWPPSAARREEQRQ